MRTSELKPHPGGAQTAGRPTAEELREFRERVARELYEDILPFWIRRAPDPIHGGFVARLTNDLRPDPTGPKGLILNARILWTFSAVYRVRASAEFRAMADRAFAYLCDRFLDSEFGGAYWFLDAQGRVIDDSKKTYGQAFLVYALAEYAQATGLAAPRELAASLFQLIERHAHDATHLGYVEACHRDWSEARDLRLSAKDQNEKKSMNNHLHVLEAYTNLYRLWPAPEVRQRLAELLELFERRITDPATHHFHHFFDERWAVRSDSYTYGHDIEGSWLLCEAAEVLGDLSRRTPVEALALKTAGAVLTEGLAGDGGLCYEGRAGRVINADREFWPQAEAVVGFLNAFQLSAEPRFFKAARRAWDYAERHLVDRTHGEWFWRVDAEGRPDRAEFKVSEWKCPYHNGRACLEALRRLDEIGRGSPDPGARP